MERSLNPTYSLGPTFETVTRGLDDGATLTGLWLEGSRLWSVDTQNTRLMTYIDSLTLPVVPVSPPDEAQGIGPENINLDWEVLKGATKYKWQLDYDTDFSTVPSGFEGEPEGSSARLPELEMATTYYWRVRATEPVLSPWSPKYSFTTSLGTAVSAPELYSPEAGVSEVPIKPLFQWSAIDGADSYELLVADEPSFSQPVIVKVGGYALPATAYQSGLSLDYNTTYYWKTRACGSNNYSAWSATGVFTTELPPLQPATAPELSRNTSTKAPTPTPTQMPTPATLTPSSSPPPSPPPLSLPSVPSVQSTLPDWVAYLTVALLLTMVVLLVTLLVLVAVRGRS
ncbi:fibronectin type III domain-containing protein [Chloroflexota bacterium]